MENSKRAGDSNIDSDIDTEGPLFKVLLTENRFVVCHVVQRQVMLLALEKKFLIHLARETNMKMKDKFYFDKFPIFRIENARDYLRQVRGLKTKINIKWLMDTKYLRLNQIQTTNT